MPSLLQHNASLRTHRQVLVGGPARASSDNPRLWPVLAAFRHAVFRGDLHGSVQVVSRVFGSYVAIPGRGPGGAWLSWSLSRWDGPGLSVGTGFPRPGRPGGRESGGSRGGSLQSLIRLAEDFRRASAEPFSADLWPVWMIGAPGRKTKSERRLLGRAAAAAASVDLVRGWRAAYRRRDRPGFPSRPIRDVAVVGPDTGAGGPAR